LLTAMMAKTTGLELGDFIHTLGDVHLYNNHLDQARTQLERMPRPSPQLKLKNIRKSILEYEFDDFELLNYEPHPHISAPVAV